MSGSAKRPMIIGTTGTVFIALAEDPGHEGVGSSQHT
jgi:hypothetical protein